MLLLPRTDGKDAMFLAEKLRKAVADLNLPATRKHRDRDQPGCGAPDDHR